MIKSKPRHGEPLLEIRNGQAFATTTFQRWIDDVTAQINALETAQQALEVRVEALEAFHP